MGLLDIFKPKQQAPTTTDINIVNTPFTHATYASNGNTYSNPTIRGAVDTIARNGAKLRPYHSTGNGMSESYLNDLLQNTPNEYMTGYDLMYKVISQLFQDNNAYIFINKDDKGKVLSLFPLKSSNVQLGLDKNNQLFVKYTYPTGEVFYFDYADTIHLKRHLNNEELTGESNNAIDSLIRLSNAQFTGNVTAIENGSYIRGILKVKKAIVKDEQMKKVKEDFARSFLSLENSAGLVAVDESTDYIPIDSKGLNLNEFQFDTVSNLIYDYYGVSKKIINNDYNENEWQAFYEGILEPLAMQLSQEFTRKIFTKREIQFNNRIIFEPSKLQYSSNESKVKILKELLPMGLYTINEARELLNLPLLNPAEGNKRLQSLNYIDSAVAKKYQLEEPIEEPPAEKTHDELKDGETNERN